MRSSDGVGTTPPKVLGAPKPTSSVMMSRMFGASLGGTTRGAHQAFARSALSWMTPPKLGSGGGSCLPSIVVVASGDPGVPVVCCAFPGRRAVMTRTRAVESFRAFVFMAGLFLMHAEGVIG